jgi:hypothetical protein
VELLDMTDDMGEFITESSADVTKMLRDRFRSAATFFATPGILLLIIGLVLWLWVEVSWYIHVVFFVGAALLFVYSAMLLSLSTSVPSLKVYEGGVLLKPPKGRTTFLPWKTFKGYTKKEMGELEVIELHRERGEPISIHKYIPHFDRIGALVEENVPPLEG